MIAPDLETAIDELQDLVEAARVIAPFTGAGISTECGIPDFRSPGGLWTKNRPIPFDEFLASQEMRDEAWRRRFAMDAQFSAAQPGPRPSGARQPLSRRQGAGGDHAEYRQSASEFGNSRRARDRVARQQQLRLLPRLRQALRARLGQAAVRARERARARLPECGGHIKTATISFGQAMPEREMRRAEQLTLDCDLVSRNRLLAGGMAGRRFPAARETKRRPSGDHQSRGDRIRRHRRSGCARRHRIVLCPFIVH